LEREVFSVVVLADGEVGLISTATTLNTCMDRTRNQEGKAKAK
jgi:hypothetical protein